MVGKEAEVFPNLKQVLMKSWRLTIFINRYRLFRMQTIDPDVGQQAQKTCP
jgi:hypothetical protein